MESYQKEFIEFSIECGVLRFGEFTLKSGRISPYFFNTGLFNTGAKLSALGEFYASAIIASGLVFDGIYGPAYKGIPLASATAIGLSNSFNINKPYCFNRKEAKDHGEGGNIVGAALTGNILIVDDVITAGTAIREVMGLIRESGASASAVLVALDRQERGLGELSAIQEIEKDYNIPVISIINLGQIVTYLENKDDAGLVQFLPAMKEYQQTYGI